MMSQKEKRDSVVSEVGVAPREVVLQAMADAIFRARGVRGRLEMHEAELAAMAALDVLDGLPVSYRLADTQPSVTNEAERAALEAYRQHTAPAEWSDEYADRMMIAEILDAALPFLGSAGDLRKGTER